MIQVEENEDAGKEAGDRKKIPECSPEELAALPDGSSGGHPVVLLFLYADGRSDHRVQAV